LLPLEARGYAARESVFHMLWEMNNWLETYVKNRKLPCRQPPPPRNPDLASQS
jgi:hypothetical protein